MRQPIGRMSETWQCGVRTTTTLNMSKTKELIVDCRKRWAEQAPINIDRVVVERVESFKFLGVHITNELSCPKHTKTVVKRARQHSSWLRFPLRRLKSFGMGPRSSKNSTAVPSRASGPVASPPGMATARHLTVRRYRG
jgi:hypothetical protein